MSSVETKNRRDEKKLKDFSSGGLKKRELLHNLWGQKTPLGWKNEYRRARWVAIRDQVFLILFWVALAIVAIMSFEN